MGNRFNAAINRITNRLSGGASNLRRATRADLPARSARSLPSRGRILHLSDLHLGPIAASQYLDHHRQPLSSDRLAQRDVLKVTLDSLASSGILDDIEAVVVTGDLTNRGKREGFDFFANLAEILCGPVEPENVIVVPGNHDVCKEHPPGDPKRYAPFLAATRDLGFATPLLDGIDFGPDGELSALADRHPHLVRGRDFTVMPLNSSHYCWVTEPLPHSLREELDSLSEQQLDQATEELRTHDMPRVSNPQMLALRAYLAGQDPIPETNLCLAALHHQLLPVDAREELKSFEGLTNLGAVREFLADLSVDVVLHGHKHAAALYWDYIAVAEGLTVPPQRVLVSAAPARFAPGLAVGRILELGPSPLAPELAIEEIHAGRPYGSEPEIVPLERARIWRPQVGADTSAELIAAEDFDAAYARLQSRFADLPEETALRYLICEISRAEGLDRPPAGYPEPHSGWFADLVEWWQFSEPSFDTEVTFNHGDRIRRRWGDQVGRAAHLLSDAIPHEITTTRASILLLDPERESSPPGDDEFPSFVSIQLQLVERAGAYELDCTGYFRKQEMRYWWPINVAELGRVQAEVLKAIRSGERAVRGGTIRTIAAHAIAKGSIPAVAHPAIDRAVDRQPAELWRLAYGLLQPGQVTDRSAMRAHWDHYLEDLRPSVADKLPARSRRGLQAVLEFTKVGTAGAGADSAIMALGELVSFYSTSDFNQLDPSPVVSLLNSRLAAFERALDEHYGPVAVPGGGS
jgi:predicted MPP superfamily phosphohydrolase